MADSIDAERMMTFVERYERLEEEKKSTAEDQKQVMDEAKSAGFEPKWIKFVVAQRKIDSEKRKLIEAEKEVYLRAAGLD